MSNDLLLLEDDDALRHHLGQRLARHGYQVFPCADLAHAQRTLDSLPDLHAAILDQNIGNENGLDLISPVLERFPSCRVLILTGYGSIPAAVSATRLGACNYLTKPASIQDILHALEGQIATTPVDLPDAPPSLERLEWEHIQRVLDEHDGNISSAARVLGIHRRTLQRRLKKRPAARDYDRDRPTPPKPDIH